MTKPRYHIIFYYKYWVCGDGCCSDSWYDIEIEKDGEVVDSIVEDRSCLYDDEDAQKWADSYMKRLYLEKDQYDLTIDY